jgi:hypothetical protein
VIAKPAAQSRADGNEALHAIGLGVHVNTDYTAIQISDRQANL